MDPTTSCRALKTLSREQPGVGGLLRTPALPLGRERQQVLWSWYVTGSPSLLPRTQIAQNGHGKCRVSVATNIFRARCCTHSPRFATQGCSSPSCSAPGGSCPAGWPSLAGRAGPQGLVGSFPPPPHPQKEPKALVQPWVAPRWGSSSAVPLPGISSVFHHQRWAPPAPPAPPQHPQVTLGAVVALPVRGGSSSCPPEPHTGTPRGPTAPKPPRSPSWLQELQSTEGRTIPAHPNPAWHGHQTLNHLESTQRQRGPPSAAPMGSKAKSSTPPDAIPGWASCALSHHQPPICPKLKPFQARELNKPPGMGSSSRPGYRSESKIRKSNIANAFTPWEHQERPRSQWQPPALPARPWERGTFVGYSTSHAPPQQSWTCTDQGTPRPPAWDPPAQSQLLHGAKPPSLGKAPTTTRSSKHPKRLQNAFFPLVPRASASAETQRVIFIPSHPGWGKKKKK